MTWKQRQLSGECAAKCISGSIKHYSSSALVAKATDWQMQGKMEKPRPLAETLAVHCPCELVFTGEHMFPLRDGWNNGAVLLIDKMPGGQTCRTSSAEPSCAQAYARIDVGINSVLSVVTLLTCMYVCLGIKKTPETFLLFPELWWEEEKKKVL